MLLPCDDFGIEESILIGSLCPPVFSDLDSFGKANELALFEGKDTEDEITKYKFGITEYHSILILTTE